MSATIFLSILIAELADKAYLPYDAGAGFILIRVVMRYNVSIHSLSHIDSFARAFAF